MPIASRMSARAMRGSTRNCARVRMRHTPVHTYHARVRMRHTPVHTYYARVRMRHTPVHTYYATVRMRHTLVHTYRARVRMRHTPVHTCLGALGGSTCNMRGSVCGRKSVQVCDAGSKRAIRICDYALCAQV